SDLEFSKFMIGSQVVRAVLAWPPVTAYNSRSLKICVATSLLFRFRIRVSASSATGIRPNSTAHSSQFLLRERPQRRSFGSLVNHAFTYRFESRIIRTD